MIGSSEHPILSFGLPPDLVAIAALIFSIVVALPWIRPRLLSIPSRLLLLCLTAATLSFGYFVFYLQGAPRIIDATTYLLEARSFAQGSFSFEVPEPSASFRGRFLIHTASDPKRLAAIFPPGYPALLALGVALGLPFLVGPVLAAGLVYFTYRLAHAVTGSKEGALVAAGFSTLCAALRYQTAETMSHGFSALLTTCALWSTVELIRKTDRRHELLLGVALGLLTATRQLSGMITALVSFASLLLSGSLPVRRVLLVGLGALPGLSLLLAHHYSITGDPFTSPQTRYYDFADGPPGCFGLGLGKGCAYEHADVVAQQGGKGLTVGWMLRNTLHRFHYHLMDIAHFEPLAVVALLGLVRGRAQRSFWPLGAALVGVPAGYSLFYFAGSYPGAGARLFSELLPVWHVLLAAGLLHLNLVRWGLSLCLLGFAVHASFSHRALGAPHFGPQLQPVVHLDELLTQWRNKSSEGRPLILFRTAHEFNLAHLSSERFVAARRTFDAREQILRTNTETDSVFEYDGSRGFAEFHRLPLGPAPEQLFETAQIFETEFDFPPLGKNDLWVHPAHLPHSCVSRGRALALHIAGSHPELELELPVPRSATLTLDLHGIDRAGDCVVHRLPTPETRGRVLLKGELLRNLSHIDRLVVTPTHL